MSEKIAVLRCSDSEHVARAIKEIPAMLDAKTSAERETYFGVLLNELDFEHAGLLSENKTDILDSDGRYVGELQEGDLLAWHNETEDTYTLFQMGDPELLEPCSFCGTTGFVGTTPCQECKGKGQLVSVLDDRMLQAEDLEPAKPESPEGA